MPTPDPGLTGNRQLHFDREEHELNSPITPIDADYSPNLWNLGHPWMKSDFSLVPLFLLTFPPPSAIINPGFGGSPTAPGGMRGDWEVHGRSCMVGQYTKCLQCARDGTMSCAFDDKEIKPAFWEFMNANAGTVYAGCLCDFLMGLLRENVGNVESVILFGGLVRDGKAIPGWSDIDLLVVFTDILNRSAQELTHMLDRVEVRYGIRVDLTQVDREMLSDPVLLANCYNSELLNSLAMRTNVSAVLYGTLPVLPVSPEQEKLAARFYIDQTLAAFHRYLIECVYRGEGQEHYGRSLARVTRWLFSIIRASLRLFDVYVHPYDPSLRQVETLFPNINLSVPNALLSMRKDPATIRMDYALFVSIEGFLQNYVACVLRKWAKNQPPET